MLRWPLALAAVAAACATPRVVCRVEPAHVEPYATCRGQPDPIAQALCIALERKAYALRERDVVVLICEQDKIEKLEMLRAEVAVPDTTLHDVERALDRARRAIQLAREARHCQGFIPVE